MQSGCSRLFRLLLKLAMASKVPAEEVEALLAELPGLRKAELQIRFRRLDRSLPRPNFQLANSSANVALSTYSRELAKGIASNTNIPSN